MPGSRIVVLSDNVPGGVNSSYECGNSTRNIHRSELPLLPDKAVHHIILIIETDDLATVVDVLGCGGNSTRKVDQGSFTLCEQIAMLDTGSGIDVETNNLSPLIDPVVHRVGHRIPSHLAVVMDNSVHAPHKVIIVLTANDIAF